MIDQVSYLDSNLQLLFKYAVKSYSRLNYFRNWILKSLSLMSWYSYLPFISRMTVAQYLLHFRAIILELGKYLHIFNRNF